MSDISAKFVGVELYFSNRKRARDFYTETLGLRIASESTHFTKFETNAGFICLEQKGVETYRSSGKAVLFFEVPDLGAAIAAIGHNRLVHSEPTWAVMHDPEGHNIVLLQAGLN